MREFDTWFVVVTGDANLGDDEHVLGVYAFEVDASAEPSEAVSAILDEFHRRIGIEELDAFDIAVVDPQGRHQVDEEPSGVAAIFAGRVETTASTVARVRSPEAHRPP